MKKWIDFILFTLLLVNSAGNLHIISPIAGKVVKTVDLAVSFHVSFNDGCEVCTFKLNASTSDLCTEYRQFSLLGSGSGTWGFRVSEVCHGIVTSEKVVLIDVLELTGIMEHNSRNPHFNDALIWNGKNSRRRSRQKDRPLQLVVYFKEMKHHGANDRLIQWLLKEELFESRGVHISVLTCSLQHASHDHQLIEMLQVPYVTFDSLCIENTKAIYETKDSDAIQPLVDYLSSSMDFLVLVNTYGEDQSNLLLSAVANIDASLRPTVLLDLPNLAVPPFWLPYLDGLIAPSKYVAASQLTADTCLPVTTVYPPIASDDEIKEAYCYKTTRHVVDFDRSEFQLIFVGRLDLDKTPGVLLRALHYLFTAYSSEVAAGSDGSLLLSADAVQEFRRAVVLKMFGDGPLRQELEKLSMVLGLQNVIEWKGSAPHAQILHEIRDAHFLVNPILQGETFGLIHVEAAMMGTPVIAYDIGANGETVRAGILMEYNIDALMETLAKALLHAFTHRYDAIFSKEYVCRQAQDIMREWTPSSHALALIGALQSFDFT